jgi:hypothetical protein
MDFLDEVLLELWEAGGGSCSVLEPVYKYSEYVRVRLSMPPRKETEAAVRTLKAARDAKNSAKTSAKTPRS